MILRALAKGSPWVASLLPLLVLLLLWQWLCAAGAVAPHLLPSPLAIVARLAERLQEAEFLFHIGQTLLRLLLGFAIALAAGMALGLLMSQGGEAWMGPAVRLLAPVPKIALYPIMVLLLGYGHASKVALVVADVVFPILMATFHGARSVPPKLLWSAWSAGASPRVSLLTVVLPAALPSVLTACRIGLVIASINVFLAEMISSTDGLGHLLVVAARSYQVVDMFVPLVLISAIGLGLSGLLAQVRRRLLAASTE